VGGRMGRGLSCGWWAVGLAVRSSFIPGNLPSLTPHHSVGFRFQVSGPVHPSARENGHRCPHLNQSNNGCSVRFPHQYSSRIISGGTFTFRQLSPTLRFIYPLQRNLDGTLAMSPSDLQEGLSFARRFNTTHELQAPAPH